MTTDASTSTTSTTTTASPGRSRMRLALFIGLGLAVALALAFFVSPGASSEPDGLNKVAIDEGFADQESAHATEDSPLAGYGVEGVDDDRLSTGLAGIIGVVVTFAVVGGGLLGLRRIARRRSPAEPEPGASAA
jgi:cobalt/nickel transport protein